MIEDTLIFSFITGFFLEVIGWLLWFWPANNLCKQIQTKKEDSRKNRIKGDKILMLLWPLRFGLIGVGGYLAIEFFKLPAGPLCLGIILASVLGRIYIYMKLGRP